ncbi:Putative secreted protein [Sphingopyxis fribergensis]|uniref:Putative secreted protein n=1 Tax=Sphingopyxis fribergensis TaxID=1515612 RepID=A0A0A7PND6_9SPHN|nr:nuclear transport factor 2 family protein [Sphingopyxis fribergensis]AJA10683.1 Putative secreted protein [Sphingopyxis fribergensis]
MRIMIAAALAFCVAAPAIAADAPASEIADLRAFADAFDAAQIAQDRAALERMVADDLVFIDGSGKRYGKAFFIDGWTGADHDYDPVTLSDRVILPVGPDAGLASAETILSGRSAGKPFRVRIRFTDIFRRHGDSWQATYIHVTRMALDAPAP